MSDVPASLKPRRDRSVAARRAARQAKADRDQRILRNLCAGLPVAELAVREGLSDRRMRALVQEVLARRTPEPPAEYLALQVARLNEAMLVAYSAMSGQNLKAVDRVVKITRELDRYHGLGAASIGHGEDWRWAEIRAQRALRPRRESKRLQMAPELAEIPGFWAANDGQAAAAIEPRVRRKVARRLETAPQAENPQSAAGSGPTPTPETRSERGEEIADRTHRAAAMGDWTSPPQEATAGPENGRRLETAPQALESPQLAAESGAPPEEATQAPATAPDDAIGLEMAPQAAEIPQSPAENGAPPPAASEAEPAHPAPPGDAPEPAKEASPAEAAQPKRAVDLTFAERFPPLVLLPNGVALPPRSRVVPAETPGAGYVRCKGVTTWYLQDG